MPPENNQNFNQSIPQQPQKSGSGLNTILLILLIALVGFGIWFLSDKKEDVVVGSNNTEFLNYQNEKLGVSFSYPKNYGDVTEKNEEWNGSFEYQLSLANGIRIIGKSNPYTPEGRGAWEIDLTESEMSSVCDTEENQLIKTKNGIDGVFSFSRIAMYDSCEDIAGFGKGYYAVFDLKTKIQNMVISASPDKITKEEFIKFVNAVEINKDSENQNNTQTNPEQSYEDTPESQVTQEQSDAYIVNFEKRIDGFNYITLDYVTKGNGVGLIINENQKLRTFRSSNNLKVQVADSSTFIIWEEYIENIKKYNEIWVRSGSNIDGVEYNMASSVYTVKIQNGLIVEMVENIEPQG